MEECCVCFCELSRGSAINLACSHRLCRSCMSRLEQRAEGSNGPALCPICRAQLASAASMPQSAPAYTVRPSASNPARQRRLARKQAQAEASITAEAAAPHVAPTPVTAEALQDLAAPPVYSMAQHEAPPQPAAQLQASEPSRSAATEPIPPHLQPLSLVMPDAPASYLAHLLELAGGDADFAIAMHFDGGGVVPDEWRAAPAQPAAASAPSASTTSSTP